METIVKYEVWLSTDDDNGQVDVVVTAVEYGGQSRIVGSRTFQPWSDWNDISAWVWNHLRLDTVNH